MIKTTRNLAGHIIASLPSFHDQDSDENVYYIFKHDEDGAMGFALNQSLDGIMLSDLMEQLVDDEDDWNASACIAEDRPVFWGGGQELARAFVLHSLDVQQEQTLAIDDVYGVTSNTAILKSLMAADQSPAQAIVFLGYTGWKAGQLDKELARKWIILPSSEHLLFSLPASKRWRSALAAGGLDEERMTSQISLG